MRREVRDALKLGIRWGLGFTGVCLVAVVTLVLVGAVALGLAW